MPKQLKKSSFKEFYKINEYVARHSPMRTHYNSKNTAERWLWQQKKVAIKDMLGKVDIESIVDFGCGDGGLIKTTDCKTKYTGMDISPTQIKYAKAAAKKSKRKNVKFCLGDILDTKFKTDEFDAALACDVAEHVMDFEKLFTELKRVVKKNGYIVVSIPNEPLLQLARLVTLRFPLRSPDHLYSISVSDVEKQIPETVFKKFIPVPFSSKLSLIRVLMLKNV